MAAIQAPSIPPPRGGRAARALAWALVAAWSAWGLARLLGLERGFPLVPMIAFTPYVAAASVIPIAVAVSLRRWMAASAAVAAAVVLAALVLPRAFGGGGPEVDGGVRLGVMSANAKLGRAEPETIAALVAEHDVDVLAVQELTGKLAGEIEALLGERLPHRVLSPAAGSSGSGIYSAMALRDTSGPALPGGFPLPRALARVQGAPPIEIVDVHTQPPTGPDTTGRWGEDLRSLPDAEPTPLRLLVGDFNATLDHDGLRAVIDRGYTDAADAAGAGLTPTWPEQRRFPPLVAIDHVLADERIEVESVSIDELAGSDHRAVFAELVLPAG